MPKPRRTLNEVSLEPAQSCPLELRRPTLGVQTDELESVLERQVRQLAGRVLGHPQCATLDRTAEADVGICFRRHERMFPQLRKRVLGTIVVVAVARTRNEREDDDRQERLEQMREQISSGNSSCGK
jgi:hypothetical protein